MDGLKPGRGDSGRRANVRSANHAPHQGEPHRKARHSGEKYWLVRSLGKLASKRKLPLWQRFKQTEFAQWPDKALWNRAYAFVVVGLFIFSTIAAVIQPFMDEMSYKISDSSRAVIPNTNAHLGTLLKFNTKEEKFIYNEGYKPAPATATALKTGNGDPRFNASFAKDPKKGASVTDPVNSISVDMKPKFKLGQGRQDKNQIVYPLAKEDGFLVYTAQVASVKEDILLQTRSDDKMSFEYELGLPDGTEARLEKNGSVGIYGSSMPLYGNVSTGSDKDAELLQKAKQNAKKDKFLFGIPAPVVKEKDNADSRVRVYYQLKDNNLTLVAENLKQASYPLAIDPSIYIQTAAQLMYGNNETNVDFDVATEQFKKGFTTGARINTWTETGELNSASYDQGVAASAGYVYRAGGRTGQVMPWVASKIHSQQSTSSSNFTMSMPANRPAGDLYIAVIAHVNTGNTNGPGSNWVELLETREHSVWYKVGDNISGGNEAASYTWTNTNSVQWAGAILRIKNAQSTPTFTTANSSSASDANPSFPAVTPTANGALILRSVSVDDDTVSQYGFSPADHDDVISGNSNGVSSDTSYAISALDSPNLSGVSAGAVSMPTSQGVSDTYGSSSIVIYGNTATPAYSTAVQWAHFNNANGSIDTPAPGSDAVACTGWCNNSVYDLPNSSPSASNGAGLVGMSLVAYNGYLYAIGGYDGTNVKSTVYISKLGSNGEPSLWHPTDPDQADWAYWHKDTGLNGATARAYQSAYAYNGKMYMLGGRTSMSPTSPGSLTTVEIADILPNGTLGSWSSGQALPTARYGASVQVYNNYLYVMGGNSGTTIRGDIYVSRLLADGSMSSWQNAAADGSNSLPTAKTSMGGAMSAIWGGYLYLSGGCTAINTSGSGYCTAIDSSVQLASINADGTLDIWNTMNNLRQKRFGSSFIAWQNALYRFGGCSRQDATTGACYATHLDVQYGNINQDGDASTVSISTAPASGNCVDPDPYDCSLPPGGTGSGQGGQMLTSVAILNGFIYVIGGCTTNACTTMSANTSYAAIDSNGRLKSPPTCEGGTNGSWCVDSTNQLGTAVGGAAVTVFNGYIYIIGGTTNNTALSNHLTRNKPNADGSLGGAWVPQNIAGVFLNNTNLAFSQFAYGYAYARANPANAGTVPGNLFLFGGCTTLSAGTCTAYTASVYKCRILADASIDNSTGTACTTTGQQGIGTVTGASGAGLGAHSGAVYANFIYLVGGAAPGTSDLRTIRYAKFDNSNNVVAVTGSAWVESGNLTTNARSRGAAFGYNGYLYVVGGYNSGGVGVLRDIEFAKINVSDGSIGAFSTSIVTINQRWGLGLIVSNSYAYVIGGCNLGTAPTCSSSPNGLDSTVQTFQIYNNDSGAPGNYTVPSNLYTTDRLGAGAAVHNGYMYIAGGCVSATDCTDATDNVQFAAIDANGAIGSWANTTDSTLPGQRAFGQLEVVGGTLYFIGGQEDTAGNESADVFFGTPSGNGQVASWANVNGTGDLPGARTQFSSAVWNNRIYVTGGLDGSAAVSNVIYASPSLSSGGDITSAWTATGMTGFTIARSGHVAVTYANNIYILGGYDGTNYLSDVQFAKIDSSGTIGSWTYTTSLPSPIRQADGFASNGYMYIFGGRSYLNDCAARTLIAPISANTALPGNNPTGVGEWYQTNRNFDGGRFGVAAVLNQGKAYLLGGGCQGIVMQDDFDTNYDASQWSSVANMAADYRCTSTSITRTLSGTVGGTDATAAIAATKDVNVSSGGTVLFKLYTPTSNINTGGGDCYALEPAPFLNLTRDGVRLQYSTNGGGAWVTIGAQYAVVVDPLSAFAVTIPGGAQTASTRFRWHVQAINGAANSATDSFALEDVYIIATGNNDISYASSSRITQSSLLSQPQVAIYSRQIDTGADVFPTKWLMNGIDNSIGARWQLKYRSMNDPLITDVDKACGGSAMSSYGQTTDVGDVTLGTVGVYTVKNSGGTNISCGRYFFMTISVDASQTYGYPDDITRGPTLDNLTLFYNSNPGRRLIHGQTFTEGIKQPLDTQPD